MEVSFDLTFPTGAIAKAARIESETDLEIALCQLELTETRPTLVIVGGAAKLSEADQMQVRSLFVKVFAPLAQTLNAAVLDGGTDSGIMRLMGRARSRTRSTFPLIGVTPIGVAGFPGQPLPSAEAAPLEPNHTHFILVPGEKWGDESGWIAQIASRLADDSGSLTILINGGEITWQDASQTVQEGRHLVAIAGSGRTADVLAKALNGKITDERARRIVDSGLLQAIDLRSSDHLAKVIWETLAR